MSELAVAARKKHHGSYATAAFQQSEPWPLHIDDGLYSNQLVAALMGSTLVP